MTPTFRHFYKGSNVATRPPCMLFHSPFENNFSFSRMARKTKSAKPKTQNRLRVNAAVNPENYIGWGTSALGVGSSALSSPNTAVSLNDYIMNNNAQFQLGSGANLRLGKHIFFTYLRLKLRFTSTQNQLFRITVGKAAQANKFSVLSTGTTLGSAIEGEIFEGPLNGGSPLLVDWYTNPSTEYQILYDKTFGVDTPFAMGTSVGYNMTTVDVSIPLMLQRMYDNNGAPDRGDWFLHIASSNAAAGNTVMTGTVRLDFINQFNWEVIPRAIKGTISAADDVLSHASGSTAIRALLSLLKMAV